MDRMANFFTEITFFKFPDLSYTLTSCIKLPRFNLFTLLARLPKKNHSKKEWQKFSPLRFIDTLPLEFYLEEGVTKLSCRVEITRTIKL